MIEGFQAGRETTKIGWFNMPPLATLPLLMFLTG